MTICCNLMEQPNTTKSSPTQPNQLKDIVKNASPIFFDCKKSIFISFSNLSFELLRGPPPLSTEHVEKRRYKRDTTHPKTQCGVTPLGAHQLPSLQSPVPASRTSLQPPISAPGWGKAQSRREVDTTLKQRLTRGRPGARQC